jgi:hypothetical protein
MTRVGRRAAGWLPVRGMPTDVTAQLRHTARHVAQQAGRDPNLLRRKLRINLHPGQNARNGADARGLSLRFRRRGRFSGPALCHLIGGRVVVDGSRCDRSVGSFD